MSYSYSDYYDFARRLAQEAQTNADETLVRNAVSRAYYSCLHGAKEFIEKIDEAVVSDQQTAHEQVWGHFKHKSRTREYVYSVGQELKRWREWADYNDPKKTRPQSLDLVFSRVKVLQDTLRQICMASKKDVQDCWFLHIQ